MSGEWSRQASKYRNQLQAASGELLGLAEGMLADKELNDDEIQFLDSWLRKHESVASEWPGDLIYGRLREILADGVVTADERSHLVEMLKKLVGGSLERMDHAVKVNHLSFDDVSEVGHEDCRFVLTGTFVIGSRVRCAELIETRGGVVGAQVTKDTDYLLVGALGSDEWKEGSYGTKIIKAMKLKAEGLPIVILHENTWERHL